MSIRKFRALTWFFALVGVVAMLIGNSSPNPTWYLLRIIGPILMSLSICVQACAEFKAGEIAVSPTPVRKKDGERTFALVFAAKLFFGLVLLFGLPH